MGAEQSCHDIAILGAGPAGSSLAAALARMGWSVLLVERRRLPAHKVCGEFLSPEAQSSLWALGVHDAVAALAPSSIDEVKLISPGGAMLVTPLPGEGWGVSRYALDAALAAAAGAAGATVRTGVSATGIVRSGASVEVRLRAQGGRETVCAGVAVVACGRHPTPGLRANTDRAIGKRACFIGIKQHYEGVTMPSTVELYFFKGGYAGVAPVEDGRVNVCLLATKAALERAARAPGPANSPESVNSRASVNSPASVDAPGGSAWAGGASAAMLEAVARWNPALGRRLAGGRPVPGTAVAVAPVDTGRPAVPWQDVARLGDAAVMVPPLVGDGMAMALRSAELCAPLADAYLRGELSLGGWADAYAGAWHREFDRRVRVARWVQSVLAVPSVADAAIGLGRRVPGLASTLVGLTRGRARDLAEVGDLSAVYELL